MQIKKFTEINDFLLGFLTPAHEMKTVAWQDIYEAISVIQAEVPDGVFLTAPLMYCEMDARTIGFLFPESATDAVYYVYR